MAKRTEAIQKTKTQLSKMKPQQLLVIGSHRRTYANLLTFVDLLETATNCNGQFGGFDEKAHSHDTVLATWAGIR
ncbi:hypothetical protein [Paenibacillus sp. FSL H7-0714]|uniref:hypothetical protein n=1 Tax=Paenibacillus sp. FSL H7-0714 TaxID=2954735 RepID=UPI0030F58A91